MVDMDGNVVEGNYKPSSDTATHLVMYRTYPQIGGVVHTHSTWAVTFAQAGMDIPASGTTHADYFYGDIPCTRDLTAQEIEEAYEKNTGNVIVETIGDSDVMAVPGIVVKNHGPFAWGKTPAGAVYNAVVLDKVAEMAYKTMTLNPRVPEYPSIFWTSIISENMAPMPIMVREAKTINREETDVSKGKENTGSVVSGPDF